MFDTVEERPPEIRPEDLIEELDVVLNRITQLEARAAVLASQVTETRAFDHDGYSSTTSLLKQRGHHSGTAHRLVVRGNGLRETPLLSTAYQEGLVTSDQVDVLLHARFLAPDAFEAAEADLVDLARHAPLISELRRRVDYWVKAAAPEELESERQLVRDLEGVRIRRDQEMIHLQAWFPLLEGEKVLAAIEPGPPRGDRRPVTARRAERLRQLIAGKARPAHLVVHVDLEALTGSETGLAETQDGTVLTADELSRLACDPQVSRVVFGPGSQPLDLGRTKRLVTPALKLAVIARDRHCRFHDCDEKPSRCQVHHIIAWLIGGKTKLDNLILLCPYHHMLVHEGGWTLTGTPGHLTLTRPDQTYLDNPEPAYDPWYRPPPPSGLPPGGLLPVIQRLQELRIRIPP